MKTTQLLPGSLGSLLAIAGGNLRSLILGGIMMATTALPAGADDNDWSGSFVLYLLGPTLDGTVGIGPADGDVSMDAGDVFDTLDGAFLGIYSGEGENWGVVADVVHMDLKDDSLSGPTGIITGEVGNTQTTAIVSLTYRLSEHTRTMAGFMYTDITARFQINSPTNSRVAKTSEQWVDPVLGVAYQRPVGARWDFTGLAQVGGFGVGADMVYVLTAGLAYRFNDRSSFTMGYRYLDFDYEDGSGRDRFKFDMKQHGPALGVRFDF